MLKNCESHDCAIFENIVKNSISIYNIHHKNKENEAKKTYFYLPFPECRSFNSAQNYGWQKQLKISYTNTNKFLRILIAFLLY